MTDGHEEFLEKLVQIEKDCIAVEIKMAKRYRRMRNFFMALNFLMWAPQLAISIYKHQWGGNGVLLDLFWGVSGVLFAWVSWGASLNSARRSRLAHADLKLHWEERLKHLREKRGY